MRSKHGLALIGFALAGVLAACSTPSGAGPSGETPLPACGAGLDATSAKPTTAIPIETNRDLSDALVSLVEPFAGEPVDLILEEGESEFLLATPFHPESLTDGGALVLRVEGSDVDCTWPLVVEPLPDASEEGVEGAYERRLDALQAELDGALRSLGIDPEIVKGDPRDAPPELLPFLISQYLLDHPDNPNDVRDIIQSGEVEIGGGILPLDMGLLDGIAAVQVQEQASQRIRAGTLSNSGGPVPICAAQFEAFWFVPISTLDQLMACLEVQGEAAPQADKLDIWSTGATAIGALTWLAPSNPIKTALVKGVLAPATMMLVIENARQRAMSLLLPDGFSIDFDASDPKLLIGEQGRWTNVEVTPTGSEPFDVASYAVSLVSASLAYVPLPWQGFVADVTQFIAGEIAQGVAEAINRTSVDAFTWEPVSVPDSIAALYFIEQVRDTSVARRVISGGTAAYEGLSPGKTTLLLDADLDLQRLATGPITNSVQPIEVVGGYRLSFQYVETGYDTGECFGGASCFDYRLSRTADVFLDPDVPFAEAVPTTVDISYNDLCASYESGAAVYGENTQVSVSETNGIWAEVVQDPFGVTYGIGSVRVTGSAFCDLLKPDEPDFTYDWGPINFYVIDPPKTVTEWTTSQEGVYRAAFSGDVEGSPPSWDVSWEMEITLTEAEAPR